jgi:RNase H-like domain found in reverse transcriptase
MCNEPVLAMPNFAISFIIETDASELGMRVVLMQGRRPIALLSKAFGIKNRALSTYEKELLALLTDVQKWRHYLQGQAFIIKTDHLTLKHILEQKFTHALQHKELCKLLGLQYEIQYKKDSENIVVDALSRNPELQLENRVMVVIEILFTPENSGN